MNSFKINYIYDPLCGWCYASAPALQGLVQAYSDQLEMHPSGLFSGAGARPLNLEWADYAWTNDQRIGARTGLVFSTAYHQDVLLGTDIQFDSGPINRALTAVRRIDRTLEPRLLHDLQVARYVQGQDTASARVIGRVAAELLVAVGRPSNEQAFAQALNDDHELSSQTDRRVRETKALMGKLGIRGVPQVLIHIEERVYTLESNTLYGGPDLLISEVKKTVEHHRSLVN
ncbi:DsbA family protein [Rhizobium sp. Root1204]|uniref:DsbA family protein n=1 Tax=Rhizobium sp. Root1204 TaxID=1736428 RepID=UPI000716122D|nr:DsbA family protein [Rhizobium sp. Root1204]KQV41296.1 hypothetical protein ASC96_18555 [Rhizobium sp. Root1204]